MKQIAFLISNRYQIHHYAPIARHLGDVTFVIEHRQPDFGVTAEFIQSHLPGASVAHIDYAALRELDGEFQVIVCQTPVLPNRLLTKSLVVAQQYSLAKESYQYGLWRSLCSLNLMYGPYSLQRVAGFSPAVAVGNPALDTTVGPTDLARSPLQGRPGSRSHVLYAPTYGSMSSHDGVLRGLADLDVDVTVKLHHADRSPLTTTLPAHWRVIGPEVPVAAAISESNVVLSDLSGVIFDAIAMNRPVIVVDRTDTDPSNLARLSSAETDGSRLAAFTARWSPGQNFVHAIEGASALLDRQREELLLEYFVNLGEAGRPAAEAIDSLLQAPVTHPSPQIRADAAALMKDRFTLAQDNRRLRRANDQLRGGAGRRLHRLTNSVARRARDLTSRWPRLQSRLAQMKHRLTL